MNIPNFLTALRILLIPLFVIFLIDGSFIRALAVFIVGALTDAIDGFIARITGQRTIVGLYLDPIADKLFIASSYISLSLLKIVPAWLTVMVISRDIFISVGVLIFFIGLGKIEVKPTVLSKATTIIQTITIMLSMFSKIWGGLNNHYLVAAFFLTALFTLLSGFDYLYRCLILMSVERKIRY